MKIFLARTFAIALVLVLTATGLWAAGGAEAEPAAAAEKEMVLDPTTGEMVEAPRYGGTLTYATNMVETGGSDAVLSGGSGHLLPMSVVEKPAIRNWALDRNEWGVTVITANTPLWSLTGALAESWETPDDTTIVLNIRKGVHWHDKPPMNGRELTADDIVFNYHRYLGLGSGFTESANPGDLGKVGIESVTASDNYTVVIELERPHLFAQYWVLQWYTFYVYPPEVIEQYGDANNWRNLVGTGPFMLTDYVEGSSVTFTKNPNYWGFDEKYPENRLPYVDEKTALIMREGATRLAALRSGKLDYMGFVTNTQINNIDQVESLARTNPEIAQWPFFLRSDFSWGVNVQNPPFDDIRVRKAMQMALDLETINDTFFRGRADTTPSGPIGKSHKGWQIRLTSGPKRCRKAICMTRQVPRNFLMRPAIRAAPTALDSRPPISTTLVWGDLGFAELALSYWREIGVDVEMQVPSSMTEFNAIKREQKAPFFWSTLGAHYFGEFLVAQYYTGSPNAYAVSDPQYDAMIDTLRATPGFEEYQRLFREANQYAIEKHWAIWGPDSPQYQLSQPWVKGYNGEASMGNWQWGELFARVWIDQELKAEMGN